MKAEIKQAWVEALRSGKYKQGTGELCNMASPEVGPVHCCLGVLCELAIEFGVPLVKKVCSGGAVAFTERNHAQHYAMLPPEVQIWSGVGIEGQRQSDLSLAVLNDSGSTFAEIADIIEKEF